MTASFAAALVLLLPATALCCPYCAARGLSGARMAVLAGFLLVPYLVGAALVSFVRRISADEGAPAAPPASRP